jgi:Acetyltransferase (GNAT) family
VSWRPLTQGDLPEVDRIADAVHTELPERLEIFLEKFRLFPGGCFALEQEGKLVGYGISHPWTLNEIPPLDSFLKALPDPATCLYLHDVAIIPEARGHRSLTI